MLHRYMPIKFGVRRDFRRAKGSKELYIKHLDGRFIIDRCGKIAGAEQLRADVIPGNKVYLCLICRRGELATCIIDGPVFVTAMRDDLFVQLIN